MTIHVLHRHHHFKPLKNLKAPKKWKSEYGLAYFGAYWKGWYKAARSFAADYPGALFCRCGVARTNTFDQTTMGVLAVHRQEVSREQWNGEEEAR